MTDEKPPEHAADGPERIYNLFVYVDGDTIAELGVAAHHAAGTDAEKGALLKSLVDSDHVTARRARLVDPVERCEFEVMMRLGVHIELFEDLQIGDALWLITPIVDGTPTFRRPGDPPDGKGEMVDYLQKYSAAGKLDVGQLLNDDHFVPIKLLLNAGHYISAAKLLMSFVDTIAYIEFGDIPNDCIFARWLDHHVDLAPIGITSRELWEYRNGLLHMSNLASRAVLSRKVARLIMYVGPLPESSRQNSPQEKYFNLMDLIRRIASGLEHWVSYFAGNRAKALEFVYRYDLTVSDARLARIEPKSEQP